jgi:hypothetical protein
MPLGGTAPHSRTATVLDDLLAGALSSAGELTIRELLTEEPRPSARGTGEAGSGAAAGTASPGAVLRHRLAELWRRLRSGT